MKLIRIWPALLPVFAATLCAQPPAKEVLHYSVEWRLITAGKARLERSGSELKLRLESSGLVNKLFRVDDTYTAQTRPGFCATSTFMTAHEASRHRETRVTYDAATGKASYVERDLAKNSAIAASHEIDIPPCVHEILGALEKLRTVRLDPGQSTQLPLSDGKKSVSARIEAQAHESIKIKGVARPAQRFEAFLFNNVLYRRNGRLFIWLADDAKRTPLQIQVRLTFAIGTITLQLDKEE